MMPAFTLFILEQQYTLSHKQRRWKRVSLNKGKTFDSIFAYANVKATNDMDGDQYSVQVHRAHHLFIIRKRAHAVCVFERIPLAIGWDSNYAKSTITLLSIHFWNLDIDSNILRVQSFNSISKRSSKGIRISSISGFEPFFFHQYLHSIKLHVSILYWHSIRFTSCVFTARLWIHVVLCIPHSNASLCKPSSVTYQWNFIRCTNKYKALQCVGLA